jgi:uridylate kinase
MAKKRPRYRRILLKISGEALVAKGNGIDAKACSAIAAQIAEVQALGVEVALVIGGGNIVRGAAADALGLPRTPADQAGMLATVINGIVLKYTLAAHKCPAHLMSAIDIEGIAAPYSWEDAEVLLAMGDVVIFVGGTGHPYFTTDTAAALRAKEIGAELLIKFTKVDGVYDRDPHRYGSAIKFPELTYAEVLSKRLQVMDMTAIAFCQEAAIPIQVISLSRKGALLQAVCEGKGGSFVRPEPVKKP